MDDGKYIIVETHGHEVPILFHSLICHAEFVEHWPTQIVSAGFFTVRPDRIDDEYLIVNVQGGSPSLRLTARPEDEDLIEKLLSGV